MSVSPFYETAVSQEECNSRATLDSNMSCVYLQNLLKDGYSAVLEQQTNNTSSKQLILEAPFETNKYFIVPKNTTFTEYRKKTDIKEVIREAVMIVSAISNIRTVEKNEIGIEYGCKRVPMLFLSILSTLAYAIIRNLLNKRYNTLKLQGCFDKNITTVEDCDIYVKENPVSHNPKMFNLFGLLTILGIWFLWAFTQGPLNKSVNCNECHARGNQWLYTQPSSGEENVICSGFQRCNCEQSNLQHMCNTYENGIYEWSNEIANKSKDGYICSCCLKKDSKQCIDVTSDFKNCHPK